MSVVVLYNPKAGSASLLDALRAALGPDLKLVETRDGEHLKAEAAAAVRSGAGRLAVAGGDGTIHAVVNALGPDFPDTPLAILPLGTGNDLCRTLAIPLDPAAAAGLVSSGQVRALDVIRVEGAGPKYVVNAMTGGFSGQVAKDVTGELKGSWGPFAYLRGAVGTVIDPPSFHLTLRLDGGPPRTFDAINLVVANGRTAAGGVVVAPTANPEDGLLDVVVVTARDTLDLAVVTARLLEGDYVEDEHVLHFTARRVEVESDPPLPVSLDGEKAEGSGFAFEVVPRALRMVVGSEYTAAPAPKPAGDDPGDDEPDDPRPRGIGQRLFGLLAAFLLLGGRLTKVYAAGLWVSAAAVAGFALLAAGVLSNEWDDANDAIFNWVNARRSPALDSLFHALTWMGGGIGAALAGTTAVLAYTFRRRYLDAATLAVMQLGGVLVHNVLKAAFQVARPAVDGWLTSAEWYSFPSGHAVNGFALYAGLAALLVSRHPRVAWRWAVGAGLVLVAAGIAASRVYLRVHWPTDVIGGAIAGVCWITFCMIARHSANNRLAKRVTGERVASNPPGP